MTSPALLLRRTAAPMLRVQRLHLVAPHAALWRRTLATSVPHALTAAPRWQQQQHPQQQQQQQQRPFSAAAAAPDPIIDVDQATFSSAVMESPVPVILDVYADWCGPCKQLTPVLEKAVRAAGGKVILAKMDSDANPQLSQALKVQSLPTVMLIFQGKMVDQFVGSKSPAEIAAFVQNAAALGGAAAESGAEGDAVDEGAAAEEELLAELAAAEGGDAAWATTEPVLARFLQLAEFKAAAGPEGAEPAPEALALAEKVRALAHVGLLRCALADGATEGAESIAAVLRSTFEAQLSLPQVTKALGELKLKSMASEGGDDLETLLAEIKVAEASGERPTSEQRYSAAVALSGAGRHEEAVEQALQVLKRDKNFNDGAAKTLLFEIFDVLGPGEAVNEARKRMSSYVF